MRGSIHGSKHKKMLRDHDAEQRFESWLDSSYLSGKPELDKQLYEDFLTDPDSVDANWRSTFQQLLVRVKLDRDSTLKRVNISPHGGAHFTLLSSAISDPGTNVKQVKVLQLISAYRFRGHQHANLDPLGLWRKDKKWPIWIRLSTI